MTTEAFRIDTLAPGNVYAHSSLLLLHVGVMLLHWHMFTD